MKLGLIGCAVLCVSALIYMFLFETQSEVPLQKNLELSNQNFKESILFSSKILTIDETVSKPLEVSNKERISDAEIKELEKEMADSVDAYNQSVVDGQPDSGAIEKISELKEKYKQIAMKAVLENNK